MMETRLHIYTGQAHAPFTLPEFCDRAVVGKSSGQNERRLNASYNAAQLKSALDNMVVATLHSSDIAFSSCLRKNGGEKPAV